MLLNISIHTLIVKVRIIRRIDCTIVYVPLTCKVLCTYTTVRLHTTYSVVTRIHCIRYIRLVILLFTIDSVLEVDLKQNK